MKSIVTLILYSFFITFLTAQDISGTWYGLIDIPNSPLRINFNFTDSEGGYSCTLDSPDQGASDIPTSKTTFQDSVLTVEIALVGARFIGRFDGENIEGTFYQGRMEFPLRLTREQLEKKKSNRPQLPELPLPYDSEEVTFTNSKHGIKLAGTFTKPSGNREKYPVVVFISGSGPQNRDEEIFEHRPFYVFSDYLTKNGIATLRFDDRGVGDSEGDHSKATTQDFAVDVQSAVEYLRTRNDIEPAKIGLIGHSEGGIIAPIVAANNSQLVSFIILLAGTGIPGDQLLLLQQEDLSRAAGLPDDDIKELSENNKMIYEMVKSTTNHKQLVNDLKKFILEKVELDSGNFSSDEDKRQFVDVQIRSVTSTWFKYFLNYDPSIILRSVKCPVLAINGEKDLQVASTINLRAIEKALKSGGNQQVKIKEYPDLNHMFQKCETGLISEYSTISQTIDPQVLKDVTTWIQSRTGDH